MCLAVLVPIVNAINILTHGFGCNIDLFLVFLFSELFGTRAYALVQITQKIKKTRRINLILHLNPCVRCLLIMLKASSQVISKLVNFLYCQFVLVVHFSLNSRAISIPLTVCTITSSTADRLCNNKFYR